MEARGEGCGFLFASPKGTLKTDSAVLYSAELFVPVNNHTE